MKLRFCLFPAPLHDSMCPSTKTCFRRHGSNTLSPRPAPHVFLPALNDFFVGVGRCGLGLESIHRPFVLSSSWGVLHKCGLAKPCYVVVQVFSPPFFFFFFYPGGVCVPEETNSDCWWPNGNGGLEERGFWSLSYPCPPPPLNPPP